MICQAKTESVVLIHGLAAPRWVMSRLARSLRRQGYRVKNWGSCSVTTGAPGASVDRVVEQAYSLFVQLAKRGSVDLAYPTPLALAALRLDQQKRRSSE